MGEIGGTVGGAAPAGQQLRAQFCSIHACVAPLQKPWDAHAAHVACESTPTHELVVAGIGAVVAMGKRGAPVSGVATTEQQLRLQLDSIQACAAPVHCP